MKTQNGEGVTPPSHPCRQTSTFTLRGRKKDGLIRGRLRIRSIPGAFLVLGVIVVVVGTALAVAGYWPYWLQRTSILEPTDGKNVSESQTSGSSLEGKPAHTASPIHSERIKLLGPVIMGVGLFILICATTILYENRDRETQMLLAQMRSVICSVSATVHLAELKERAAANSMARPYHWVSSLPAAHLNILLQLASSEPLLLTRHPRDQERIVEGIYQQAVLQTEVLHDHESEPPLSLHSCYSNSCNSSQTDFYTQFGAEHGGSASFNLLPPPLVKLNSCLVSATSLSTLDKIDMPAIQPRRCHSMSYRTDSYRAGTGMPDGHHKTEEEGKMNQVVLTGETGSQVCVNKVMEAAEKQTGLGWT
ncbi:uncharacterized protein tmem200b [Gasterosteus aculeatus]